MHFTPNSRYAIPAVGYDNEQARAQINQSLENFGVDASVVALAVPDRLAGRNAEAGRLLE